MPKKPGSPQQKPSTTLPGTVEKIIQPPDPRDPEKAQIDIQGAEDLYREIRIDNTLKDQDGEEVALKQGAQVEVTVKAHFETNKPDGSSKKKD